MTPTIRPRCDGMTKRGRRCCNRTGLTNVRAYLYCWVHLKARTVMDDELNQGYTLISDGCTRCGKWINNNKLTYIPLVVVLKDGRGYWECPGCMAGYGPVSP